MFDNSLKGPRSESRYKYWETVHKYWLDYGDMESAVIPGLLLTSRQTFLEAEEILYSTSLFSFESWCVMDTFIEGLRRSEQSKLMRNRLGYVREIQLDMCMLQKDNDRIILHGTRSLDESLKAGKTGGLFPCLREVHVGLRYVYFSLELPFTKEQLQQSLRDCGFFDAFPASLKAVTCVIMDNSCGTEVAAALDSAEMVRKGLLRNAT